MWFSNYNAKTWSSQEVDIDPICLQQNLPRQLKALIKARIVFYVHQIRKSLGLSTTKTNLLTLPREYCAPDACMCFEQSDSCFCREVERPFLFANFRRTHFVWTANVSKRSYKCYALPDNHAPM